MRTRTTALEQAFFSLQLTAIILILRTFFFPDAVNFYFFYVFRVFIAHSRIQFICLFIHPCWQ